jgi:hypothetical protein
MIAPVDEWVSVFHGRETGNDNKELNDRQESWVFTGGIRLRAQQKRSTKDLSCCTVDR